MRTPKISIIVPVFKVEKCLKQCLDSIIDQTFEDWECILVDDGSPDNSGSICDEYAQKDLRFRVIHKENGGVSSARNLGIDKALGDFILFVDSDDFIECNYLEVLILCPESDIIVSGFRRFGLNNDIVEYSNQRINLRDELKNIWSKSAINFPYWYPWCKLFKTSIIRGNKLKFKESLFYSEDFCFVVDYLNQSETLYVVQNHGYVHFQEPNRFDKFKMTAHQLYIHYYHNDIKLKKLEAKCNYKFDLIRGHLYMRLLKNFFAYLRQCDSLHDFMDEFSQSNKFIRNMYTKETMMYFSLKKRIMMLYFSKLPILCFFLRKKFYTV